MWYVIVFKKIFSNFKPVLKKLSYRHVEKLIFISILMALMYKTTPIARKYQASTFIEVTLTVLNTRFSIITIFCQSETNQNIPNFLLELLIAIERFKILIHLFLYFETI